MANNKSNRKIHVDENVKEFAKATLKHYKKENGDYYDSKKELRRSYNLWLVDKFSDVIEFIVKYGHINDEKVQKYKAAAMTKINDPDFIKVLTKEVKKGNDVKNIDLMPIVIYEILLEAKKRNDAILAENPNGKIYDVSDLVNLSKLILKKKIKKFSKAGIDQNMAFELLSIIPTKDALEFGQWYRIRQFYDKLYDYAKTNSDINFDKIVELVINKKYQLLAITFALLERKEKFGRLNDSQKSLYLKITNWCFDTMEHKLKKAELDSVLTAYINGRIKDDKRGHDSNRRYTLSSLSPAEYERIANAVKLKASKDDNAKKYL